MEHKTTPPINPFFPLREQIIVNDSFDDRKEPHIVFLSNALSKKMRQELDKKNMTFEIFIYQACVEYLNKIDNDNAALNRYLTFSEMQLSENNPHINIIHPSENNSSSESTIPLNGNNNEPTPDFHGRSIDSMISDLSKSSFMKKAKRHSKEIPMLPIQKRKGS